ncbi:AidA/PixA family protein [Photorhabdus sp. SF281]|uniref:AidA/PixA family protein n=1 Tax=Photorhabdus sp. SF281 TaxID=3459527 RepID=UPI004044D623
MNNNTIDILVAVDVESILSDMSDDNKTLSPYRNNPTQVNGKYFYYITTQHQIYSINQNASDKLILTGRIGDIVRWRSSSLSAQFDHQAFLYKMETKAPPTLITAPELLPETSMVMVPNMETSEGIKNTPYTPIPESDNNVYQQSTLTGAGNVEYTWYIAIYNRAKTKDDPESGLVGYCYYTTDNTVISIIN